MKKNAENSRRLVMLVLVGVMFVTFRARAVTIYVDIANAGSPTMDGSAGDPWDTIQKGVDDITNQTPTYGHTVLVETGIYSNGVNLSLKHSGETGNHNVLLSTNFAVITSLYGVELTGVTDFTIDGFNFDGCSKAIYALDNPDSDEILIQNCNMYNGSRGWEMQSYVSGDFRLRHCNIVFNDFGVFVRTHGRVYLENCNIVGNQVHGIVREGGTVTATNCLFYANLYNFRYESDQLWNTDEEINALPGCTNNIVSNPGFTDIRNWNFNELMANSPCLGAGRGGVDIGAHQDPPTLSFDQATYHVSASNGNDSNDGLSLATAWRTITNAAVYAKAGDTVLVQPGVYTGTVTILRGGSSNVFVRYIGEDGAIIDAGGCAIGIELSRVFGVYVEGLTVESASSYGL